ncbi:MAG: hypothetical protein MZV65_19310 [Chromatiales bacterium]|nr:hypothetical protein [Chromatiales bacterium]
MLATHVPLGQEVLKRGIVFIDLAHRPGGGAGRDRRRGARLRGAWLGGAG